MKNIRIEEIGDINFDYPYLEVFFNESKTPFSKIGISEEKQLSFKLYALNKDISIGMDDWEEIYATANTFLLRALKNEDNFLKFQ